MMCKDLTYWFPNVESESLAEALSVPSSSKEMQLGLFQDLFRAKLAALIVENPREARYAMDMSQEGAPEFWAIAEYYDRKDWPAQIVASDSFNAIFGSLSMIGSLQAPPVEKMSFRAVLEQLLP